MRLRPSRAHTPQHSPWLKASATVGDTVFGTRKGVLLALIFSLLEIVIFSGKVHPVGGTV